MQKILGIILSVLMIFSIFTCSSSAAGVDNGEDTAATTADEPRNWKDYDEAVKMYICASANSLTGHVWLYFVNLTDCDIPLGYATLKAGDEMSVGSFRNTRKDGGGTYYNAERMMATLSDADNVKKHTFSMGEILSPEEVESVSEKIKRKNSYDLIFNNCGVFAASIWNSVSEKKVIHIVLPVTSILFISANGGAKGELRMKPVTPEECLKQTKDGCKQASDDAFKYTNI